MHILNWLVVVVARRIHGGALACVALSIALLAGGNPAAFAQVPAGAASVAAAPDRQGMEDRLAACAFCHGKQGEGDLGRRGGVYPRLAGQPAGYLYQQMEQFVGDERTGIPPVALMRDLLKDLSPDYLQKIATFYQEATPAFPPPGKYDPAQLQRGRTLVEQGLPAKQVPACTSCHGADLRGHAPLAAALAGQNERYLTVQFMHWLQGQRSGQLHQRIARALSQQQIQAVSAYLSSLRPQPAPEPSK